MAKAKERKTAYILFVNEGKTRKEISDLIDVSETTVCAWVKKYAWVKERAARNASPVKRAENVKSILTELGEERLDISRQIKEAEVNGDLDTIKSLRIQTEKIDLAVANWNKNLITMEKENKVTLAIYLHVMEIIFNALRIYDAKLFMQTIEFQENHLHAKTIELG